MSFRIGGFRIVGKDDKVWQEEAWPNTPLLLRNSRAYAPLLQMKTCKPVWFILSLALCWARPLIMDSLIQKLAWF